MKKIVILFLTCVAMSAIAQNGQGAKSSQMFDVTVETFVGTKIEDKFSFTMQQGMAQNKGFDAKLLAKRYRANGFPHLALESKDSISKEDELMDSEAKMKPVARLKLFHEKVVQEYDVLDRRLEPMNVRKDILAARIKEVEDLIAMATKSPAAFEAAYKEFIKKNEMTEGDIKYNKLMRRRPKNKGDTEEIDLGTFCNMTLTKVADKNLTFDIDYSFTRVLSYFYSDGNNNDNTITKHPIVERFEKLGIKDVKVGVGKPYCIQFGRPTPEKARSLQDAVSAAGIFSGVDGEKSVTPEIPQEPPSELDAQGTLKDIQAKFPSETNKVIRVVITVKVSR